MQYADRLFSKSVVTLLITVLVCAALAAGAPLVAKHFPDYVAGYLVQIPAIIVFAWYVLHFSLLESYPHWVERGSLALSFAIPLANTFVLKAFRKAVLSEHILLELFRPTIVILIAFAALSAVRKKRLQLPPILWAALILAVTGWLIASIFSAYPFLSLGHGFFEIAAFWLVLYVYLSAASDDDFLVHAAILFCIGFSLVALAQASVILYRFSADDLIFKYPMMASEFLEVKKNLPLMIVAGGNGFGNTDNFASLWCLVAVLLAGFSYIGRRRFIAWIAFAVIMYCGLLVYPRSALGAVVIGLFGLWLYRWRAWRAASPGLVVALILIAAIHVNPSIARYYVSGAESFIANLVPAGGSNGSGLFSKWIERHRNLAGNASGIDRAEAWAEGWNIAEKNWMTGVGFGAYSIIEPEFTAPHSMVLERIDDGGVLSLISLLLVSLYCFWQCALLLVCRLKDMFAGASIIAASAFFVKGLIFGATFSIMGMIPWGFAVALCLAVFLRSTRKNVLCA